MSKFKFCPHCATELRERQFDHRRLPACPSCSFVDWRNAKPCAGALVIRDGTVLLVKRGIEPCKGCWDIPGGFMEAHESPEQAAIRELLEETGLAITNLEYLCAVPDIYGPPPPPGSDGIEPDFTLNIYFLARADSGTAHADDDAAEVRWFPLNALPPDAEMAFTHQRDVMSALRARMEFK